MPCVDCVGLVVLVRRVRWLRGRLALAPSSQPNPSPLKPSSQPQPSSDAQPPSTHPPSLPAPSAQPTLPPIPTTTTPYPPHRRDRVRQLALEERHEVAPERAVARLGARVEHQVQQVEARQQRRRQVDVLRQRELGEVARPLRVCAREDRRARVELRHEPGLRDRDGLLLHDLVQHRARAVGHLVELVDAADALVAEHQRARLEHHLVRLGVLGHVGGQADRGRALAARVDAARRDLVDEAEQLRLGD